MKKELPQSVGVHQYLKCRRGLQIAAVGIVALLLNSVASAQVFDWTYTLGDAVHPGTIPLPKLDNASGATLAAFLAGQSTPSVKVISPLSGGTASAFFDGSTPLANIIGGFENPGGGGNALTAT